MRKMLDTLPLDDDVVCDKCLMAFWENLLWGAAPKGPSAACRNSRI